MNKKVAIIGTVGLPAKYGGFETLAEHIVGNKGDDFEFLVYCSKKAYPNVTERNVNASLKYLPLNANGVQSIPYDIWSILHSIRKVDTLLILGVSGCIILSFVKIFTSKKIIVNIDGLEWKRAKWGNAAKWFLKYSEKIAVKYADVVIADNKVIQEHIKNSYGKQAELIAYGADHTKALEITQVTFNEFPFLKENYAFKVCRIEPENNVQLILNAFTTFKKINLVIVGNWNVSKYAQNLRKQFQNRENIFLLDPIYEQDKLNQLRSNCYLYVHGHSAGGTNPSLVEAMFLKLPVLAYGINYNRETTANQALYFEDVPSLIQSLEGIQNEKLEETGDAMYKIAEENYTWKKVADSYAQVF
jgi:glycosyltransferase involved in cell wall biosynthesis